MYLIPVMRNQCQIFRL
uniref:Uncharacterized protein MANES_09G071300 n=1 Tax=Rhizophora mucronata TaxID=61149 RepID=A0A2P2PQ71_RHIMU